MYVEDLKFSLWCDFVERSFLDAQFVDLIREGTINGATSNPAIFKSAILTSKAYKEDIAKLKGKSPKEIYEALAIKDIKTAAQKLLPLYENGNDGFISIEVDPYFCDDTEATIEEGKRLFDKIKMPNVMIKVPATKSGYKAMEVLTSEGINVNATLIFSPVQAKKCLNAFEKGNAKCTDSILPSTVISIFVSRFDRKLDAKLKELGMQTAKVGVYNALKIYDLIENFGLDNVRCLFASTGVKGDDLRADYYIRELLCKNSINTAPLHTIKYFLDSKEKLQEIKIDKNVDAFFEQLEKNGVNIDETYDELMQEGVVSFKNAFQEILDAVG
ncbi:MAG: transaldolase [Epsilonproteobacteria bacterium]|nr:transaldolase [Campylobacterota bacterium]